VASPVAGSTWGITPLSPFRASHHKRGKGVDVFIWLIGGANTK
jgi:hypothetical protein